jgi:hypothetical protein
MSASNKGEIIQLYVQRSSIHGDPIVIDSIGEAFAKISQSNFYYEVYSPSMVLVDTRKVALPPMDIGNTSADHWKSYNTSEIGDYTITLCWSTGNAENCDIDYAETTEYSVPTMGIGLSILAMGILGMLLWRNRDYFREVAI